MRKLIAALGLILLGTSPVFADAFSDQYTGMVGRIPTLTPPYTSNDHLSAVRNGIPYKVPLPLASTSSESVLSWGAINDGGVTDSSAAINAAIAYIASVGGYVNLSGGTYGVCATPINFIGSTHMIHMVNGALVLQNGCVTPPQEILHNTVAPTNGYMVNSGLENITLDGKCLTKYVYLADGGNQTTHRNVVVQNPATNAAITGSAGLQLNGAFEFKFGATNWVTATGSCYNTGNLPAFGINHVSGGNADFSGVVVVNFITGINASGDDYFGPGTHVWGGCKLIGGGCSYDAALRTTTGLVLNGTGTAIGVEIDDPATAGIAMTSVNAFDRMVVIGNSCAYSATPTVGQSCVTVGSSVTHSVVLGTAAANVAAVYPGNVVFEEAGVGNTTIMSNNPGASNYAGDAPVIHMAGVVSPVADGCLGQDGYRAGATACAGVGWLPSPTVGCRISSLTVGLSVAAGVGNSIKFTVQSNGVDTPLNLTLTGATSFLATNNGVWADIPAAEVMTLRVEATAGAPPDTEVRAAVYGCG